MYIKYFTPFNQHLKTKCQALNTRSSNSVCGGIIFENFTDLLCFCKHKKFGFTRQVSEMFGKMVFPDKYIKLFLKGFCFR